MYNVAKIIQTPRDSDSTIGSLSDVSVGVLLHSIYIKYFFICTKDYVRLVFPITLIHYPIFAHISTIGVLVIKNKFHLE